VSAEALRRMKSAGLLDDPLLWLHTPCTEDVVVSLYVRSVGLELKDFNADGEVFGVKHFGLADSPERLLARGFGVIHSIRDYRNFKESDTRQFFRDLRTRHGPPEALDDSSVGPSETSVRSV